MTRFLRARSHGSIVVGVDGSAPSRAAIRWSMRRASTTGSRVVLAHIIDDDVSTPEPYIDPAARHTGHTFLQSQLEFARLLDDRITVTAELFQGDPLETLAAASENVELLAIGTHKTGFVQGRVFGSRFIQLAGLSFSPVAFIPNSASHRRSGIVVGVGNADVDEATIRFAAREASRTHEELAIIHCRSPYAPDPGEVGASGGGGVAAAAEAIASREEPDIAIRCRSIDRSPAEGLVSAAMSASLLVIGRSQRNAHYPGSVGSVVHDILLNLTGPTVVVHDTVPERRSTFAQLHRTAQLT